MRKTTIINDNWLFRYHDGTETRLDLPHTWNAQDGQDGGNDYYRGTCVYEKTFPMPAFAPEERVYLQFDGVNASAKVTLNGVVVMTHDGGYRDVKLVTVNRNHFDLDYFGGPGIAVTPKVEGGNASVRVQTWHNSPEGRVCVRLLDHLGNAVAEGMGEDITLTIENAHLWDGIADP